jgi:hypothetical protein
MRDARSAFLAETEFRQLGGQAALLRPQALAFPATTASVGIPVGVPRRELVAVIAMRLACINTGWAVAPGQIDALRAWLQVSRVAAAAVRAVSFEFADLMVMAQVIQDH